MMKECVNKKKNDNNVNETYLIMDTIIGGK